MKDALLVNPYSKDEISDAIAWARRCRAPSASGAGGR